MARLASGRDDEEAKRLDAFFPDGLRVAVLGSTDFWHRDSERTCVEIGRLLAGIPGLVLLTGGVEGIGEAVGRSFFRQRQTTGQQANVCHVLPEGEKPWDYGQTFFAGMDMTQRREILARLSKLYVILEGGPGVAHEVKVASAMGASIIAVGRSGGYSALCYTQMARPVAIDAKTWAVIGREESSPEETALAVLCAVEACRKVIHCPST